MRAIRPSLHSAKVVAQRIFSPFPNESSRSVKRRKEKKPAQVLQEVKMCQSESKATPAERSTLNSSTPKAVLEAMLCISLSGSGLVIFLCHSLHLTCS